MAAFLGGPSVPLSLVVRSAIDTMPDEVYPEGVRDVPKSDDKSSSERCKAAIHESGATLVLGAGVSLEFGVPNWFGLAERLLGETLGDGQADERSSATFLTSQTLPVVFELAERRLGDGFIEALRDALYRDVRSRAGAEDTSTSLGALAEALFVDYQLGARRRVRRVVTFNADELLREALRVRRRRSADGRQFWRTMGHAVNALQERGGEYPIPIYYVHGFLPRGGAFKSNSEHRLIFTDRQYWLSSGSQASIANRTMNAALADSHCLFIGLSMTDPNILRWLALRQEEVRLDVEQLRGAGEGPFNGAAARERSIHHHFWIRATDDDPDGILSEFLHHRGVDTVEISSWEDGSFSALVHDWFND